MDANTISAIFEAAIASTHWKRTNLGLTATVSHDCYTYTITLPGGENPAQGEITYRSGYGGTEPLSERASWLQTMRLTESAMSAVRVL